MKKPFLFIAILFSMIVAATGMPDTGKTLSEISFNIKPTFHQKLGSISYKRGHFELGQTVYFNSPKYIYIDQVNTWKDSHGYISPEKFSGQDEKGEPYILKGTLLMMLTDNLLPQNEDEPQKEAEVKESKICGQVGTVQTTGTIYFRCIEPGTAFAYILMDDHQSQSGYVILEKKVVFGIPQQSYLQVE